MVIHHTIALTTVAIIATLLLCNNRQCQYFYQHITTCELLRYLQKLNKETTGTTYTLLTHLYLSTTRIYSYV